MNLWNFLSRKRRLTVTTTVLSILVDVTVPVMTRRIPRVLSVSFVVISVATVSSLPFFALVLGAAFFALFAAALAGFVASGFAFFAAAGAFFAFAFAFAFAAVRDGLSADPSPAGVPPAACASRSST